MQVWGGLASNANYSILLVLACMAYENPEGFRINKILSYPYLGRKPIKAHRSKCRLYRSADGGSKLRACKWRDR